MYEEEYGTAFRVARQIAKKNRHAVGGGCIKDTNGRIVVDRQQVMETWRAWKLSNESFL